MKESVLENIGVKWLLAAIVVLMVSHSSSAQEANSSPSVHAAIKKLQMDVQQMRSDSSMTWVIEKDMIYHIMKRLMKLEKQHINLSLEFDSLLLHQALIARTDSLLINDAYLKLYQIRQREIDAIKNEN